MDSTIGVPATNLLPVAFLYFVDHDNLGLTAESFVGLAIMEFVSAPRSFVDHDILDRPNKVDHELHSQF